jgi:hypothetical protein
MPDWITTVNTDGIFKVVVDGMSKDDVYDDTYYLGIKFNLYKPNIVNTHYGIYSKNRKKVKNFMEHPRAMDRTFNTQNIQDMFDWVEKIDSKLQK